MVVPVPVHRMVAVALAGLVLIGAACSGSDGAAAPVTSTTVPERSTTTTTTAAPLVGGELAVDPAVEPAGQTVTGSMVTPDGRTRTYRVYVPASVAAHPDQDVPLLIALHGGLGWGAQFEQNSGYDGLAEANGFIVVYPDGFDADPGDRQLRTWNGGACCGPAARLDIDDVGFIDGLIDRLAGEQPIAEDQIAATGHSNGGILAMRLGCELADRISAVGVQSSSLEAPACEPSQPVSLLQIHGSADQNLPLAGGIGSEAVSGVAFQPPFEAAETFAAADGCPEPVETPVETNADLATTSWAPCDDATAVGFIRVEGGTHAWMGPSRGAGGLTGAPYEDLDSSLVLWNFLAQHLRG